MFYGLAATDKDSLGKPGEAAVKAPKFDWKNIDWFSPKPSKERIIIGVAVLVVLFGGYYLSTAISSSPSAPGQLSHGPGPSRAGQDMASSGSEPIPLQPVGGGNCRSYAPAGWHVTDENQQGTAFTVASPDGSMTASYGAVGVNGGAAQGLYGAQFRTPENFALFSVNALTNEQVQVTGPEEAFGNYQVLNFATASHRGYAMLYRFPIPADPAGYGLIMRIAIGNASDPKSVSQAGSVAAATRCTSQLVPPPADLPRPTIDDKTHGTGKSGDDDVTMAGTYNAQLGTGWVHDAAGNNYNVDVTNDYSPNGPDGAGYYKHNGNDWIKLENGMSE